MTMKTKKMLALLLAVAFCLGLLPIGELGLSVAKADNVTWPQITGFTYTKIYWASLAEFDDKSSSTSFNICIFKSSKLNIRHLQ